jgi:hypothetical protein
MSAVQATGKVKYYQIVVGGILLLNLPLSYMLLDNDYPIYSVFYISIILSLLSLVFRLLFLKKILSFNLISYIKNIIFRVIYVVFISLGIFKFVQYICSNVNDIMSFFVSSFCMIFLNLISIWLVGLVREERIYIKTKFISRFVKT